MADFVTLQIKAPKHVIDAMFNTTPGHEFEGHVDFNCIVPTPEGVYQGIDYGQEREKRGEWTWWTWNNAFWGTKWNAAESERRSDTSVYFMAAGKPRAYLSALSRAFPQEEIFVRFAGESSHYYAGYETYLNGGIIDTSNGLIEFRSPEMKRLGYKVRKRLFA